MLFRSRTHARTHARTHIYTHVLGLSCILRCRTFGVLFGWVAGAVALLCGELIRNSVSGFNMQRRVTILPLGIMQPRLRPDVSPKQRLVGLRTSCAY